MSSLDLNKSTESTPATALRKLFQINNSISQQKFPKIIAPNDLNFSTV